METEFEKRIAALINEYSMENQSDTPDFILARYLNEVLKNFNAAVMDREQWYGRIQHVEDDHYKIPFDYDRTGNPNIDPNYINGTTNIPSADYSDSYSVKYDTAIPIPITKPIIGKNNENKDGQTNIFIGHETGYKTGNDSTFIGRPAGQQSNFSPELQEDILKLEELGNKLLENIKELRKL